MWNLSNIDADMRFTYATKVPGPQQEDPLRRLDIPAQKTSLKNTTSNNQSAPPARKITVAKMGA